MKTRRIIALLGFLLVVLSARWSLAADLEVSSAGPTWVSWTEDIFSKASESKKLVLLDLEAVWCHWCHVMDQRTYKDAEVAALLKDHFITVRVDQDSRPDLSQRYRDYGWPATIVFNEKGEELFKRAGFIEPQEMRSLLRQVLKKRTPIEEESSLEDLVSGEPLLGQALTKTLMDRFLSTFDFELGGIKSKHKFIDADTLEFALVLASRGEIAQGGLTHARAMADLTLKSNLKLFDPVWGGVYQYSTHGDWDHPHFEKIISTQSKNLRLYSEAYSLTKDETYLRAALDVMRYMDTFLRSPDGTFYTSQDADVIRGEHAADYYKLTDLQRRAIGLPRVDKNIYARENGWMVRALVSFYSATAEDAYLEKAIKCANWILAHRAVQGGGFKHGEQDKGGPFLGDTLYMGIGLLSLYTADGDRAWLKSAEQTMSFIAANFMRENTPGVFTASVRAAASLKPIRALDENIDFVRFAAKLYHYTGQKHYLELAKLAMGYLSNSKIALASRTEPGILIAAEELSKDPLHMTIVGSKSDPKAKELYESALAYYSSYKRLEWFDRAEGTLPNLDVEYPATPKAAAFVCTNKRCSLPIFEPGKVSVTVDRLLGKGSARVLD